MIKALNCDKTKCTFGEVNDLAQISDLLEGKNNLIWLDLLDPTEEELVRVSQEFNFHPLAVEDAHHEHQRPKIDEYDDFTFIVFYTLELVEQELKHKELAMFINEHYLVTVHREPIAELAEAELRWKRSSRQTDRGIGVLVYSVMDTIVDHYFPVIDQLIDSVEELEEQVLAGGGRPDFTQRIVETRKIFMRLKRIIAPERDVLNTLTAHDNPVFDEHTQVYFRDIYDHVLRVNDTIEQYRDQITSTMDANLAASSNELNRVMRTLTGTSIILMTNATIAGIYGMNFENMPELKWQYGYFGALGVMVVISIALYLFFKRKGWL